MIGIQVNTLHELESLVKVTDILQIEVLQLFLKIPFEFSRKNFFHIQSIFATLKKTYLIKKIFIHAPDHLLLNGSTRKARILQWKRIKEMLNQTSYLGGEGVIAHLQFKSNLDIQELVVEAESVFWDQPPTIPLIFENVIQPQTIGCDLALKTAYPFLFQHTTVLHINDSKMPPNSHLDWHEHLGKGCIGLGSLGAFISLFDHNRAFIIETPKKRFDDFIENTDILRRLVLGNIKTEGIG